MKAFTGFCWGVTLIATIISAFIMFVVVASANGAPQEAAGAAIAVAVSVIPYIFARACDAYVTANRQEEILAAIRGMSQIAITGNQPVRN